MLWCWIKAILLSMSVVATVLGGILVFVSLIAGIVWLAEKLSSFVRDNAPKAADLGWLTLKVVSGVLLAAAIFGGIFAAKQKVCMVGFKKAYVESFKGLTADDQKK